MRLAHLLCLTALVLYGSGEYTARAADSAKKPTLLEQRKGHPTRLLKKEADSELPAVPPKELFNLVKYSSPAGKLNAYVSPKPLDGKKRPLIIWLLGGFSNGIGEISWTDGPPENNQSASAFRKAGVLMMYPALRGGSGNPGFKEGFYGEVDDVLGAAEYATGLDYVDTNRIYLGGHSTGGTLALLVAECPNRFRAVFSLGAIDDPSGYGADYLPFNIDDSRECRLRAPIHYLDTITTRTFVIEGAGGESNVDSLRLLRGRGKSNPKLTFQPVAGGNHFSIIEPLTTLLAQKILADTKPDSEFGLTDQEIARVMKR